MTFKETYQTPSVKAIKVVETYSLLIGSNSDSSLEDPFNDGDWKI